MWARGLRKTVYWFTLLIGVERAGAGTGIQVSCIITLRIHLHIQTLVPLLNPTHVQNLHKCVNSVREIISLRITGACHSNSDTQSPPAISLSPWRRLL